MSAYLTPADLQTGQFAGGFTSLSDYNLPTVDFAALPQQAVAALISRASAQIDGYCKQSFALTNIQERYTGHGTNKLFLRRFPLAQIPDSVFGGAGNISQSLVCDTTFDQVASSGQKTVHVVDIVNMLPGQYLVFADGTGEPGYEIKTVAPDTANATSGPGTVTLANNLTINHPTSGLPTGYTPRVIVNTLDFVQIVLPGQATFPIASNQLVVDAQKGAILNYTPLMFQNLGYATIFPNLLPLFVRYTYGFMAGQVPNVLQEVTAELCRRIVLANTNPGAAGVSEIKSGDATLRFTAWKPVAIGEDLRSELGPFRRNVGFA